MSEPRPRGHRWRGWSFARLFLVGSLALAHSCVCESFPDGIPVVGEDGVNVAFTRTDFFGVGIPAGPASVGVINQTTKLRVLNTDTGEERGVVDLPGSANELSFHVEAGVISASPVSGTADERLQLVTDAFGLFPRLQPIESFSSEHAISPDGTRLAVIEARGTIGQAAVLMFDIEAAVPALLGEVIYDMPVEAGFAVGAMHLWMPDSSGMLVRFLDGGGHAFATRDGEEATATRFVMCEPPLVMSPTTDRCLSDGTPVEDAVGDLVWENGATCTRYEDLVFVDQDPVGRLPWCDPS